MSLSFLDTQVAAFSTWKPPITPHRKPHSHSGHNPQTPSRHLSLAHYASAGTCNVYAERTAFPQSCCYKKRLLHQGRTNQGCAGVMHSLGPDMVGEEREAACTWAHTSQPICSGTWPTFSFSSGSRDFCLVGGNSTHCQERVPKATLTGSPLP